MAIKLTKINLSSTIFPSMTPRCTHAHTQLCTSIQVNRLPASQLQEHTDSRRLLLSRKGSIGKMFCMQLTTKLQHLSLCGLSKVTFLEKRWGFFFSSPETGILVTCHAPQWEECHQQSIEAEKVFCQDLRKNLSRTASFSISQVVKCILDVP